MWKKKKKGKKICLKAETSEDLTDTPILPQMQTNIIIHSFHRYS